jgi:hypothetical protein
MRHPGAHHPGAAAAGRAPLRARQAAPARGAGGREERASPVVNIIMQRLSRTADTGFAAEQRGVQRGRRAVWRCAPRGGRQRRQREGQQALGRVRHAGALVQRDGGGGGGASVGAAAQRRAAGWDGRGEGCSAASGVGGTGRTPQVAAVGGAALQPQAPGASRARTAAGCERERRPARQVHRWHWNGGRGGVSGRTCRNEGTSGRKRCEGVPGKSQHGVIWPPKGGVAQRWGEWRAGMVSVRAALGCGGCCRPPSAGAGLGAQAARGARGCRSG